MLKIFRLKTLDSLSFQTSNPFYMPYPTHDICL